MGNVARLATLLTPRHMIPPVCRVVDIDSERIKLSLYSNPARPEAQASMLGRPLHQGPFSVSGAAKLGAGGVGKCGYRLLSIVIVSHPHMFADCSRVGQGVRGCAVDFNHSVASLASLRRAPYPPGCNCPLKTGRAKLLTRAGLLIDLAPYPTSGPKREAASTPL